MRHKSPDTGQIDIFRPFLFEMLDKSHPLCKQAHKIDWDAIDKEFEPYYSDLGRGSKPIRLLSSLLLLKNIYNISDEVVVNIWSENPFYQYFSGMEYFDWHLPCDSSELTYFRRRITAAGMEFLDNIDIGIAKPE